MYFRFIFHNLHNPLLEPIEVNFIGGTLKAKYVISILTWKLAWSYHPIKIGVDSVNETYDIVYFDKKTKERLVGLIIEEEAVPP